MTAKRHLRWRGRASAMAAPQLARRARRRQLSGAAPEVAGVSPGLARGGQRTASGARPSTASVEAAVLSRGTRAARVRVLATGEEVTVRADDLWHVMPGHVVTLALERRWQHRGQLYAVGDVRDTRLDVPALGLPRLRIHERAPVALGDAGPGETEALRALKARIAATARPTYEMEQVLPEVGWSNDPIRDAIARRKRWDLRGAVWLLMDALRCELRCLDAHAHLGNLEFPAYPEHARIHYEIGTAIGDHALGPKFSGALPWSYLDNRPFLRCLHGLGLSLWRLRRLEEAARVLERLLWLNPTDEQGAGKCWVEVQAGEAWAEEDVGS